MIGELVGEIGTPTKGTPFRVHVWELEGVYMQWDWRTVYIKTGRWIELNSYAKKYYKIPKGESMRSLYHE